ncbi:unnamed protein product [Alternaria alternata]
MKVVAAAVIAVAAVGSTATIIRLPCTFTLKGYKGDFLYRTTDFAIWSTVEVGLGITAGSIATLRQLTKQALEITRSASALPWSKPSQNSSPLQSGQQLSTLKPSIEKSIIITTSGARRESASSDEEIFLGGRNFPSETWQQQQQELPSYVTSTVLDEHGQRKTTEESRKHIADLERRGSPGAASDSTIGSKSTRKVAKVHQRF